MSPPPVFEKPGARPTVTNGPPRWTVASLRARTAAYVLDTIIAAGIGFVACIPTWALSERAGPFSDDAGWSAIIDGSSTTGDLLITVLELAVFWTVWTLYAALLPLRAGPEHGQTIGLKSLGIRITMADGTPLTRRAAWRRALWLPAVLSVPTIIGSLLDAVAGTTPHGTDASDVLTYLLMGAIILTALTTDARRGIHDRFAGTVVLAAAPAGVDPAEVPPADGPGSALAASIPIEGRPRTIDTWIVTGLAFGFLALVVGATLWPDVIGTP